MEEKADDVDDDGRPEEWSIRVDDTAAADAVDAAAVVVVVGKTAGCEK